MNSKIGTSLKSTRDLMSTAADEIILTPVQQAAYDKLELLLGISPVIALSGVDGIGKTTIAAAFARKHGGVVLGMGDVFAAAEPFEGAQWQEAVEAMVLDALRRVDLVVVDDYTKLAFVSKGMLRMNFLGEVVGKRLCDAAAQAGKHLVLVGSALPLWGSVTGEFSDQAVLVDVPIFGADDYTRIAVNVLGDDRAANIDFKVIHRYSSMLQGYELRLACQLLRQSNAAPTTEDFIDCLNTYVVASNLRLGEVEALSFDSLPGAEHIAEALETNIVLPFENRELAAELGLKPKRGVLLYGPPGTGKTSIGRALAHRIQGKFFLIDGTFITEPPTVFFQRIQKVVQEAKDNSPSVLFIDDADILFKIDHVAGLSRYLLSLLDGLESATAGNVCVMMTAMDPKKIPEALLRSGRVELWLDTKAPDETTRARILQRWIGVEIPGHDAVDYAALARITHGCTPADLRRIVRDARTMYAADVVAGHSTVSASDYVRRSVEEIVASRNNMAQLLGDDRLRIGAPA
ncbi:MAG: AAA family ATPase [Rudaea sp.]|uniref:AAA family ATPase n=1 Tax=unclassified Rudaea TaxID=2627037 RepID=UPI00148539B8|nr:MULTISPECIES: ATP-binding protein [unclassified Rudaea]MBN8885792.1 AAA family ATPase [Rudaea sp.]MBR0347351.1 AAA family ATPase [Rudaea sp.]